MKEIYFMKPETLEIKAGITIQKPEHDVFRSNR